MRNQNQPASCDQLPAYVCTTKVRAGKIAKIEPKYKANVEALEKRGGVTPSSLTRAYLRRGARGEHRSIRQEAERGR